MEQKFEVQDFIWCKRGEVFLQKKKIGCEKAHNFEAS